VVKPGNLSPCVTKNCRRERNHSTFKGVVEALTIVKIIRQSKKKLRK